MKRRILLGAMAALGPSLSLRRAQAEDDFPNKAVRMIIPYSTGQSADIFGRFIAAELGKSWPHQVFVDNHAGGASIPGMMVGKQSAPDGYTLILGGSGPLGINPGLYGSKLPYDPIKDFVPVHGLFMAPLIVVAKAGAGIDSFRQLVELARKDPQSQRWGVAGLGTSPHLAGELIKAKVGIQVAAIPYRGSGPMLTDLIGGQITLGMDTVSAAYEYIKQGQLLGLAVTSIQRVPQLPDVPTVAEFGYPGFQAAGWAAFVAPAGTPAPIVAKLEQGIHKAVTSPAYRDYAVQRGALDDPRGAAEIGAFMKAEVPKWTELIVANGIRLDQ